MLSVHVPQSARKGEKSSDASETLVALLHIHSATMSTTSQAKAVILIGGASKGKFRFTPRTSCTSAPTPSLRRVR